MIMSDICHLSAVEMARLVRARELSARELLSAHLAHIERVNPTVNAIVTLVPDQALEQARLADEAMATPGGWTAARAADRSQGSPADQRDSHDVRLADLQGLHSGGRFTARRTRQAGRRDSRRQDEHA